MGLFCRLPHKHLIGSLYGQPKHAWRVRTLKTHHSGPPVAFVLDIDGVLVRGRHVLPEARRALKFLEGENSLGIRIPYILLTNGGGMSEEKRSLELSERLFPRDKPGLEHDIKHTIEPSQVVQAHTILKHVASKYSDSAVLVVGGIRDELRHVARSYGFKTVYTSYDLLAWNPSIWPFKLFREDQSRIEPIDPSRLPIAAVIVFHDPRNWGLDVQVICDVILSGGHIVGPDCETADRSVDLIFCNPDLIWRNSFERPRLGQGAFIEAFQSVFKALTGSHYPYVQYGKPTQETYRFAEAILADRMEALHGHRRLPSVYMIGDNPASDIAGANAMGWFSVLVHTGVYYPKDGPPAHEPTAHAAHIEEAIIWAYERESRLPQP